VGSNPATPTIFQRKFFGFLLPRQFPYQHVSRMLAVDACGGNVMIKELWNVGLKVTDLGGEVAFLREVGATLVLRERALMAGEEREYAILVLGGVRMLLFETVVFENLVAEGVRPGLTHMVYEVDDVDAEYARIRALGAEVLIAPTEVSATFGRRRLAFFRSPNGFVFEVMQVLERKI
jgi:catechol 2,3-dioxygenase-like lactoylglutathione lyase family enzyme